MFNKKEIQKASDAAAEQMSKDRTKELKNQIIKQSTPVQSVINSAQDFSRQKPQDNFSEQQEMLRQMFGHGSKIWGLPEEESGTQVQITHALSPSMRGVEGTAQLFGMKREPKQRNRDTANLFF